MADTETIPDLYDADILIWSEQQAELLRRRANALDWDNSPRRSRPWGATSCRKMGLAAAHLEIDHGSDRSSFAAAR